MPGDLYAQTIAKNGGEDNAFTTHDYTAFYEQIAADRLKLAMELEADRWPISISPTPTSRPSATWCWKSAACGSTTIPRR